MQDNYRMPAARVGAHLFPYFVRTDTGNTGTFASLETARAWAKDLGASYVFIEDKRNGMIIEETV